MSDAAVNMPPGRIPTIPLAKRLEIAREDAGMTQAQLGEAIGLGRTVVGKYEQGRQKPTKPVIMAWALATGIAYEWLHTGSRPGSEDSDGAVTHRYPSVNGLAHTVEPLESRILNRVEWPMPVAC